jgi:caffeyl-CoA reductase-Etf complex subunit CarE
MSDYKGVMTYCEISEGKLTSIAKEALGCGRRLADDLGQELCALLIGSGAGDPAREAIGFGADKAYVVDDPLLKEYQTDAYVSVMEKAVKQVMPQILIMGQTSVGSDLAPLLAFRLDTTASLDCVGLAIDPGTKLVLRVKPVYAAARQACVWGQCPGYLLQRLLTTDSHGQGQGHVTACARHIKTGGGHPH